MNVAPRPATDRSLVFVRMRSDLAIQGTDMHLAEHATAAAGTATLLCTSSSALWLLETMFLVQEALIDALTWLYYVSMQRPEDAELQVLCEQLKNMLPGKVCAI